MKRASLALCHVSLPPRFQNIDFISKHYHAFRLFYNKICNLRLKRATYVKFRCISAVETITLWRRRKKKTDDVTMSNKCTRLYKALTEFSYGLPSYLYAIILEVVAVLKVLCLNTILRHIISIKRISAS